MIPMALAGKKNPVLTSVALPVSFDGPMDRLALVAERMVVTCRKKGGIALAAPQVGIGQRVVVTWNGDVWVNPRLEFDTDDLGEDLEGCLSLPGRVYRVSRHINTVMTVQSLSGAETTMDLDGLEARMIQHEVDHLDGILISTRGVEVANNGPSALKF